jgi:RimJ/RimL family protein N-acetyltransferase
MADSGHSTATLRLTVGTLRIAHPITVPNAAVPAAEIVPALQGRGYATEAAAACRDYARTALGASRLIAIIHPDNRPSQRVAEKIGLRPEKRSLVHGGREAVIYAGSL